MNARRILRIAILIGAIGGVALPIRAETTLQDWQVIYGRKRSEIDEQYKKEMDSLRAMGLADLERQILSAKKTGNLDAYKKLKTAQKLLEEKGVLPLTSQKRVAQLDTKKSTAIIDLSKKYLEVLSKLRAKHMLKDDMASAEVVDAEAKRIEFTVAALETALPESETEQSKSPENGTVKSPPSGLGLLPFSLQKGLMLHYDFKKDTGGKVTDRSGNGHDGTNHDAKRVNDPVRGYAYEFDGTASISAPCPLVIGTNDVTLAIWVKLEQPNGWQYILSNKADFEGHFLRLGLRQGTPTFRVYSEQQNGVLERYISTYDLDKSWHHIVVVRDGGQGSLYVDGAFLENVPIMKGDIGIESDWYIGNSAVGTEHGFRGWLAEPMVWDRTLSKDEVERLYQSLK